MSGIVRLVGHDAIDSLVEERDSASISNVDVLVINLLSNKVVDVSKSLVSITTAKVSETPVLLYGGQGRVVSVEGGISGVLEVVGNGTHEKGPNAVGLGIGFVLIEGKEN